MMSSPDKRLGLFRAGTGVFRSCTDPRPAGNVPGVLAASKHMACLVSGAPSSN